MRETLMSEEEASLSRMEFKADFEPGSGSDVENEPYNDTEEPTEFPCGVCSATFVTRMSLIRHMILHEDDEPEQDIKNDEDNEQEDSNGEESLMFPKIPEQNLLEAILKNGSKGVMSGMTKANSPLSSSGTSNGKKASTSNGGSRPVPNLKPLPSLIQLPNDQPGKNFQCQLCGVCFWKKEDLSRHVTRTHGGAKFTCPYCNRNISRRDHLKRHIKNVHPEYVTATEVGPFVNNPAGRPKKGTFENSSSPAIGEPSSKKPKISNGISTTSDGANIQLEETFKLSQGFGFSDKTKLHQDSFLNAQKNFVQINTLQHFLEDSVEGDAEYDDNEEDSNDISQSNEEQLGFPSSGEDCMDNDYDLSGMQPEVNSSDELNTEEQSEEYENAETLPDVKPTINSGGSTERKFKCELCEAAFMSKINMQRHMSTHLIIRPHKCSVCGKGFLRKEHLTKHLSSVHSGLKYRCQFCGKDISRKDHLLRHIRNVHPLDFLGMPPEMIDSEPQISQVPAVTLSNNPNMRVAALSCDMCSEIFNHIDELMEHQSDVHSDIRKFKCEECPKAFKRKEHLVKHHHTHQAPVPKTYSCSECNKVFNSLEVAQTHLRQAHKKRNSNGNSTPATMQCNLCDHTFQQRAHLLQHLKAYHGVSNPERRFLEEPTTSQFSNSTNSKSNAQIRSPLIGKPQIQSLLGINSATVSSSREGSLGSLMGLISKGSISLSLSRFTDKQNA